MHQTYLMSGASKELWGRLQAYQRIELQDEGAYAKRLAREQGWTQAFTSRVIQEYVRFLYLAKCAGHAVTPSKVIDEAWHLHLIFTRSYWSRLCCEVLEVPLHHDPGTGSANDDATFAEQYEKTLDSYRRIFGEPPRDIWDAGSVEPSSQIRWGTTVAAGVLMGLFIAAAAGCASLLATQPSAIEVIIVVGVLVFAVLVSLGFIVSRVTGKANRQDTHDGGLFFGWFACGGDAGTGGHSHHGGHGHDGGHSHGGCSHGGTGCGHGSGCGGSGCGGSGCGGSGCGGGGCGGGS